MNRQSWVGDVQNKIQIGQLWIKPRTMWKTKDSKAEEVFCIEGLVIIGLQSNGIVTAYRRVQEPLPTENSISPFPSIRIEDPEKFVEEHGGDVVTVLPSAVLREYHLQRIDASQYNEEEEFMTGRILKFLPGVGLDQSPTTRPWEERWFQGAVEEVHEDRIIINPQALERLQFDPLDGANQRPAQNSNWSVDVMVSPQITTHQQEILNPPALTPEQLDYVNQISASAGIIWEEGMGKTI